MELSGSLAEESNQSNSLTCVCEALAKAVVEGLHDVKVDTVQAALTTYLVNFHSKPKSQGRSPLDYNGAGYRFQDHTSKKWYHLRIGVATSTDAKFIADATAQQGKGGATQ